MAISQHKLAQKRHKKKLKRKGKQYKGLTYLGATHLPDDPVLNVKNRRVDTYGVDKHIADSETITF